MSYKFFLVFPILKCSFKYKSVMINAGGLSLILYFEKIQDKDNPPVFSKTRLDINLRLSACKLINYCVVYCGTFCLSEAGLCVSNDRLVVVRL